MRMFRCVRCISHPVLVATYARQSNLRPELAGRRIEAIGFQVGQQLVERFTKDRARFTDHLDVIKFICKDFWAEVFKKQVDNLKTNHRGVFVLQDNKFRWLTRISADAPSYDALTPLPNPSPNLRSPTERMAGAGGAVAGSMKASAVAGQFLYLPCGLIKGALTNLGVPCTVSAEVTTLPGCSFTVPEHQSSLEKLRVVWVVIGYALSSSLLAIVNKYAVTVFPFPAILTALQYLVCTIVTLVLGRLKVLEHDSLSLEKIIKFLPAAATFYIAIWTNTQLLKHANVETFIVFRSSTPLLVAIADSVFMGRSWPSGFTFFSLLTIFGGAVGYVFFDTGFTVTAYAWAWAYLIVITFEMVYIKSVVMSIGLNTWGLVLYNNMLALIFFPPALIGMNEPSQIAAYGLSRICSIGTLFPVALSCVFGLTISFFGFAARKAVSATAYTVVGVTNKLLTVLINILIWDKHAQAPGLVALLVCIFGGVLYQQSVTQTQPKKSTPSDIESVPLMTIKSPGDSKPVVRVESAAEAASEE
ncbi:unnamed protein product [Closterium sp. Yama58-4]|nr:unnamed protein product [Closterium sp. Yama58-4]